MANEATLIIQTTPQIAMTCADGTGIEKGALLKIADPFTVSLADGADDLVGGIAGSEKIASNGITKINVHRGGIFKVLISGSVAIGDGLGSDLADNHLKQADVTVISGSRIWGTALETGTNGQSILFELRPQHYSS